MNENIIEIDFTDEEQKKDRRLCWKTWTNS